MLRNVNAFIGKRIKKSTATYQPEEWISPPRYLLTMTPGSSLRKGDTSNGKGSIHFPS